VSDTGNNDPYDPNRPSEPQEPQWGSTPPPPPPPSGGEWSGGQLGGYGQQRPPGEPQYGQQPFGQPAYGQPAGAPPPNYLVWSILTTIFCCLPLGIASIVFAAQVNGKYAGGDVAGAMESSRKAKQFAVWSAAAGVIVLVLYILLIVVLAAAGSS
jgi:hypothetical protein